MLDKGMLPAAGSALRQAALAGTVAWLGACAYMYPLDDGYTLGQETTGTGGTTSVGSGGGATDGGGGSSANSAGGYATSSTGGDGSGAAAGGGGQVCGEALTPLSDPCPPACSSCSDNDTVCNIDCGLDCKNSTVSCPAGKHCNVTCGSSSSCEEATINCPAGYSCSVQCTAPNSCYGANIFCSADGPCDVECGSHNFACDTATVMCGDNACSCSTDGSKPPSMICASSCDCDPC